MQSGEFFFDANMPHVGWKFVAEPTGAYQVPPVFSFTFCPYCGGELPDAVTILRQLYSDGEGPE